MLDRTEDRHDIPPVVPDRIVSGGQTGVDRGALDAAIRLGIAHGGWCPAGRLAEDGAIPAQYDLIETSSDLYPVRTKLNVIDSDGTLILFEGEIRGGTELTRQLATQYAKPVLLVNLWHAPPPTMVYQWLEAHAIRKLNVAGPRESHRPGIASRTTAYLVELFEGLQ